MRFKTTLFVTTALLTLGATAAVADPPAATGPTQSAPPGGDTTGDSAVGLAEIVVTAQHRVENIQTAPIAIDAVSADQLTTAGITDAAGLTQLIPSAQIGKSAGPYVLFYIRGVGSNASSSITDAAVSLSLDGVPLARQYDTVGQFYDLERVEVLEGPQGTLYGRNATGGAINIIPQHPVFDNSADFGISFGNYSALQTDGAINLGLSDQAAARLSFQTVTHNGYLSDGEADEDVKSGRVQFMYKPLDALSILFSTDIVEQGGRGGGSAMDGSGYDVDERIGLGDPRIQAIEASKGWTIVTPNELYLDDRFGGVKAEINWTTDFGTLTVIPAWRDNDVNFAAFYGGFETVREEDSQRSVEARFASTEQGIVHWITGAYFLKDSINTFLTINQLNNTGNQQIYGYGTDSKAAFADLTLDLTSRLRLIGGIRYTDEVKSIDGSLHNPFIADPRYIVLDESNSYKATTYRYGLQYDLTERSMLYATVATGFHSGGFFFTSDDPVFKPETIKAYTIGAKNRFFDQRLQLNLEVFDWEYHNQQLSHTAVDSQGDAIFATQNAGATRIKGVETDLNYQLARDTRVGVNLQYLDSVFLEYSYIQPTAGSPQSLCSSTAVPGQGFAISCQGLTPPNSPRWTVDPSVEQKLPLPGGNALTLNLTGHYQTQTYTVVNYLPTDVQGAYVTGNIVATFTPSKGNWTCGVFVNNVANSVIKEFTTHTNFNASQLEPPRTYGIRADAHF